MAALKAHRPKGGKPYTVTTPNNRKHALVVRLTQHSDGTVTGSKELRL
jgi:hypothetical protein